MDQREPNGGDDALAATAADLERAEAAGDDARLALLEATHAALEEELDRPASDPSPG